MTEAVGDYNGPYKAEQIGQPSVGRPKDMMYTRHYRRGMLWKETGEEIEDRMMFISHTHRKLIEIAGGYDDRFVQIWKRHRYDRETLTYKSEDDITYFHLFHMQGKVLVFNYYNDKTCHLWVYEGDHGYILGKIESVEKGLIIGPPMDDFAATYPIEVPTAAVLRMTKDRFTGEWTELPSRS